ncbi:DUF397 domain-containing protein [Streptomyces sp. NPDC003717]|uniref:DUF397 domain-containing protein n=1 Tax=Streptomyces sp. NPDC003717 TaxID=3154276 RepID=UPI0033BAE47D
MTTPDTWQKSSYSGGGEGNACVEIAHRHPHVAVRDSKAPQQANLTLGAHAFIALVEALKAPRLGE